MAEKKIGKVIYRYDRMSAAEGFDMLLRLLKVAGPAAGIISAMMDGDKSDQEAKISAALLAFLSRMDTDEVRSIVFDMVGMCRADGEPAVIGVKPFDTSELIQVAAFALHTEFGGFFDDGPGSLFGKTAATTRAR